MFIAQSSAANIDAMKGIMIVTFFVFLACAIIAAIFYVLTLQKALDRCAPENRAMAPGLVWLLFIPLFSLVWQFFVVINVAKSLGVEFQMRGIAGEPQPGKTIGLAMCILGCCSFITFIPFFPYIPFMGTLSEFGALICFILYWVKIAGLSAKLA